MIYVSYILNPAKNIPKIYQGTINLKQQFDACIRHYQSQTITSDSHLLVKLENLRH